MIHILILALPILLYAIFARIIIFHLNRYSINNPATKQIISAFIAVSFVLIIFTAWAFFNIPWNNLKLDDIISFINSFFRQNQSQNINIKF